MPEQEKEKEKTAAAPTATAEATPVPVPGTATKTPTDEEASQYFYGEALVGFDPSEITGSLIVIEEWMAPAARRKLLCCRNGSNRKACRADQRTAAFESGRARHR